MKKKIKYGMLFAFFLLLIGAAYRFYSDQQKKKQIENLQTTIDLIESKFNCNTEYISQLLSMKKHLVLKKEKMFKKSYQDEYVEFETKIQFKCSKKN